MTGGLKSWCSCFKNRRKRIKYEVENRLFSVGISVLFIYWRTKVTIQKRQKNKNFRVLASFGRVLFHIVSKNEVINKVCRCFCIIKTRRSCPCVALMLFYTHYSVSFATLFSDNYFRHILTSLVTISRVCACLCACGVASEWEVFWYQHYYIVNLTLFNYWILYD